MLTTLLFRVQVSGESCWPELIPGKTYLASRLRKARVGDYVVFPDPTAGDLTCAQWVKKVTKIDSDTLHVGGTVSWGSSSVIPRSRVLGTVLFSGQHRNLP